MRLLPLLLATSLLPAPAIAATDWHAEARTILEKAVSIPTVQERTDSRVNELVTYLKEIGRASCRERV